MSWVIAQSLKIDDGGKSQEFAISGTSAQSAAINADSFVFTPSVDCYVRRGTNPTALADGSDMKVVGGHTYRVREGWVIGEKLAFITDGTAGFVSITPNA